ncbi:970_t:CDS:10 [Entrophospora sp. SA101]|nr:10984_t:CDS:10 [Entrophospora sp. SA101]CAJ0753897.1 970_t:CDS:10 [Entrophospora sp. SA101]
MSLDKLRQEVLSNETGEERVEVNQRHLIDKILARYSAEFVVFRELLQNSDDAKATNVEIIFMTEKYTPNSDNNICLSEKCVRIIFKNNGFVFRSEDWNRLKKIAEGNPDEQKIGAFGVGFYSLFSVCDAPFVSSGTQGMAFYWRGDQLFAKRSNIKQDDTTWTTFLMDTREKEKLPEIESFGRFLATSLGFTGNLREVTVYFNEIRVIQLTKKTSVSRSMSIDSGINTTSPDNMFKLKTVDIFTVQLDVNRLVTPTKLLKSRTPITSFSSEQTTIFLRIASGNLDLYIPEAFSLEMERSTKKRPPKNTKIQMIFTGFDEHNSSGDYDKKISEVFKDLLPFPGQGRIFIGFPTHQTTGCSAHLAARVIPTVERESVDLVDKTLAVYNKGMLCLAGVLARIIYDDELSQVSKLYREIIGSGTSKSDDEPIKSAFEYFQSRAAHALAHFSFKLSTPNNMISRISESQFFNCTQASLSILSSRGVLPIKSVRIPNPEMSPFIKTIPTVAPLLLSQCDEFFKKAKDTLRFISEISLDDLFVELESRILNEQEIISLFKWWINYRSKNLVTEDQIQNFMRLVIVRVKDVDLPLNCISYFINPSIIPPDVDLPSSVLPYSISKHLNKKDFEIYFRGWIELTLVAWVQFISSKPLLEQDPAFSEKFFGIVSRHFKSISKTDQETIKQLLFQKNCIPTTFGMKVPDESYFPSVNLFPDLPIIKFQHKINDDILLFLGVRKHVELQLIFDRLICQGSWDHMQLIKYLAINNLKDIEIKRLALGLRDFPPIDVILQLASSTTPLPVRQKALKYFIENFKEKYSKDYKPELVKFAFLPCSADPNVYATPSECYSNPECAIMKFNVLHRELRHKAEEFGIKQNPDRLQVLEKLRKEPPENEEKAKLVFSYLSSFQNHFIHPDWLSLSQLAFIPIREKKQSNVLKYGSPQNCFFKSSEESFAGFFYYIDFGEKANKFLQSCGVKNEPSPIELAEFLINSSHDFLKSVGDNIEKYLAVLHRIAVEFHSIQRNQKLLNNMKRYPILLGMTKKQSEEGKNKDKAVVGKNEADNSLNQVERYVLATPNEIYINDNAIYQDIFEPLIFFSEKGLGCPLLTNSVKSSPNIKGVPKVTQKSKELQNLIKERSPLFFHEVRKADIVNNESWVKKLNVLGVDQIETTYVLAPNNITKIEHSNTCVISHDSWKNDWTLYIKHGELDTLDIASMISQYIYKKPQLKEATLISMLLMMPLNALKRKGFPVERIMSQQKSFRRVVENSDNPKRPRIDEQMTPNNYNTNRGQLNIAELENYSKQLQSTFPECDPNYIKSCLAQENSDHLMKVANKLAEQDYPKKQSGIRNDQEGSSPWNIFKNLTEYVSPGVSKSHADKPPVLVSRNTTEDLKRTLNEAVNSCRSNSGSAVDSQAKVNIVSESQSSYCDVMPGHSLKFIGMENGIELYIGKNLDQTALLSPTALGPLRRFIQVLKYLCDVFGLHQKAVHCVARTITVM